MDPAPRSRDRYLRVDRLFAEALERPAEERDAFLKTACGADTALRAEVERLLAADEKDRSFLEVPAGEFAGLPAADELPELTGQLLGAYRLLGRIGRGGMGEVYLARRADEQFDRRVAVKILRRGLLGTEAQRRFHAERKTLARLEHPGIARLYDGGTTADGRPFLVMEQVDGLPIDQYAERHGLRIEARLDLMRSVCAAVDFAHRNLVVHRDLKPGNILVDERGGPKLLDFGIAEPLAEELGPGPDDQPPARWMTPSYASPEQVRGEPVTTASDVYALGVVLYRLLTGCGPYPDAETRAEVEWAICEETPMRPSEVVVRSGRSTEPAVPTRAWGSSSPRRWSRRLRGDLDAIVLKALEKDPQDRYATAANLADDLRNFLRGRPVTARNGSQLYRAAKFARRHAVAVAVGVFSALVLAGFLLSLVVQGRRLAHERDKAREALGFLVTTFKESDPYETGGAHLTAQDVLETGAERVTKELTEQPEIQAELMAAIGQVYVGLGQPAEAAPLLERSLALRRQALGEGHPEVAVSLRALGDLRYEEGNYRAAEALYRQALAIQRQRLGRRHPEPAATLNKLGAVLTLLHRPDEADALHREALSIYREQGDRSSPEVAATLVELAVLAEGRAEYEQARRLFQEALTVQEEALGERHPEIARTLSTMSSVLVALGELDPAEAVLLKAVGIQRESLDAAHPDLTDSLNNLAVVRQHQGDLAGAEQLYREVLQAQRARLGAGHPSVATSLYNLGSVSHRLGKVEEAERALEESLAIRRRVFGERHVYVAEGIMELARVRSHRAPREAIALEQAALSLMEDLFGSDHMKVALPLGDLAIMLRVQGDVEGAETYARRALAIRIENQPADHWEVAWAHREVGVCLLQRGRYEEAERPLVAAHSSLAAQFPAADERVRLVRKRLAELYRAWGKPEEARKYEDPAAGPPR